MEELSKLRSRIDQVDRQIVSLLAERLSIVRQVAKAKRKAGIPVVDRKREIEVLRKVSAVAKP